MKRRKAEGSFSVSGPYEEDHPVPSLGAGMSCAQTFASRNRQRAEEITYYVRDLLGQAHARVTKTADGVIVTTVLVK